MIDVDRARHRAIVRVQVGTRRRRARGPVQRPRAPAGRRRSCASGSTACRASCAGLDEVDASVLGHAGAARGGAARRRRRPRRPGGRRAARGDGHQHAGGERRGGGGADAGAHAAALPAAAGRPIARVRVGGVAVAERVRARGAGRSGLLGAGRVGSRVRRGRSRRWARTVLAHDPALEDSVPLDELLPRARGAVAARAADGGHARHGRRRAAGPAAGAARCSSTRPAGSWSTRRRWSRALDSGRLAGAALDALRRRAAAAGPPARRRATT